MAGVEDLEGPQVEARAPVTVTYDAIGTAPPRSAGGPGSDVVVGQIIGRYQVRRLLGQGGMGRVFLARHIVIGRSVALKIVVGGRHPDRFLSEARAIARLNHPNIVQLYEFGEYERGLYLALEYIDGDTLRDRMRAGRIEADDALRYTRAIAEALAHAHAAEPSVLHCDVKPSNVMLGRDGRVRVVDFGIARTGDDDSDTSSGTADWMAPEQWAAAPLTDRTDIWALAIVCAQLLTGVHPLGEQPAERHAVARDPEQPIPLTLAPGLPGPVVDLITRSLVHRPASRPSAATWARTLDDILTGRAESLGDVAPYPGLAAFDEHHATSFFGRDREIDELVERLRVAPVLPIVGPSGSGKSSFLQAGVIPRLRRRERWVIVAVRPGRDPISAVARAVVAAEAGADHAPLARRRAEADALRAILLGQPGQLAVRLAALAAGGNCRVLLAVDQLEEAFTQCDSEHERAQFLTMVLTCADDPLDPVRVVVTMRDDFLGRVPRVRALFVLQKLGDEELRRTIVGPLARSGYDLDDPTIVDDLLREVGHAETANLPLLQFACRTLWDGRDTAARRLLRATYQAMGGLAGALAQHAERALSALASTERPIARQVLLHLVAGTTRRSVPRDQLIATIGPAADPVVDHLVDARLLVQRMHGGGDGAIVEIAHESLIQTWGQLARWLEETRDERRLLDELWDATSLWERRGRRGEETWSAADIATARHRAAQLALAIPAGVQAFLTAGTDRHRSLRRRRRIRLGMALAAASAVALIAFTVIARYLAREQFIRANAGVVDLVLAPFDLVEGAPQRVSIEQLPALTWRLHAASPTHPHEPGDPFPEDLVVVERDEIRLGKRTLQLRAPGGVAFLRLDGRGRTGEHCPPSWIRIQVMPGYARSDTVERFELEVPTCQATQADLIEIPAGPFIYGGPGDPPAQKYGDPDYTESEQVVSLPGFAIDRTEVSNGAYAPFARMESVTGYPAPIYSDDTVHAHDGDPRYPVTEIDAYQAEAYCAYLGKHLPGDHQWVKALRGGKTLDGAPNSAPRRLYPWLGQFRPECVNLAGTSDGFRWVAPVDALPCGASPYGVLNLAGNVQEWISRAGQTDATANPLYVVRGGGADSPLELEHTTALYRNAKDPRSFNYSIGLRCVAAGHDALAGQ